MIVASSLLAFFKQSVPFDNFKSLIFFGNIFANFQAVVGCVVDMNLDQINPYLKMIENPIGNVRALIFCNRYELDARFIVLLFFDCILVQVVE